MKIKIINIKENPLMKRKELQGIIEHDGMPTPSRASVQKYLAKEIKANEKHVDVRKIFSAVGKDDAKLIAFIWKDKEVPVLEEKKPKAEEKSEASKEEPKQAKPESKAEPEANPTEEAPKPETKAEPKAAEKEEKTEKEPKKEEKKEAKKENTEEKTETQEKKEAKKKEKPKK